MYRNCCCSSTRTSARTSERHQSSSMQRHCVSVAATGSCGGERASSLIEMIPPTCHQYIDRASAPAGPVTALPGKPSGAPQKPSELMRVAKSDSHRKPVVIYSVYPLMTNDLCCRGHRAHLFFMTGYLGGARKMIAELSGREPRSATIPTRLLNLHHKHLPEMGYICGVDTQARCSCQSW